MRSHHGEVRGGECFARGAAGAETLVVRQDLYRFTEDSLLLEVGSRLHPNDQRRATCFR